MSKKTHRKNDASTSGESPTPRKKRPTKAERQIKRRDRLWPDADSVIWHRDAGWLLIPRMLPLVMHLISKRGGKNDASKTYFELWCRADDSRFVEIQDSRSHAYAAGYTSSRALRTWTENMRILEEDGFIRIMPSGPKEIGAVLIVDPLKVCVDLQQNGEIPQEWWVEFTGRADEIGQTLPEIDG